jgi:pimeloyl-ACP methyl ester carboxylesterase
MDDDVALKAMVTIDEAIAGEKGYARAVPGLTALPPVEDMGRYDRVGPADGRPVVLVHGVEVTRRMWLPQVEGLAGEFRLLVPDLPAHGALADFPFSFDATVERLARLIDEEAGGRALVVGLSLGGYSTIELAARYPEKVAGAVLSGCSSIPRGPITWPHRVYAATAPFVSRRLLHGAKALVFRMLWRRCAEPVIDAGFYPYAMPAVVRELNGRDVLTPLQAYPGPILLLNGRWDWMFRRNEREFLATAPHASLTVIPGGDHGCSMGRPAEFNAAVRQFAAALEW